MRNEISLTDEEIESLFEDAFRCCISVDDVTLTRDTIDNFISGLQGFIEWDKPYQDSENGFATLEVKNIKVVKGRPKQDICVVDFGTVRGIYQSNS